MNLLTDEIVERELLRSKTLLTGLRDEEYSLEFRGLKFRMWKDYKNDCWVYLLPNGEISDCSWKDDCIANFAWYVREMSDFYNQYEGYDAEAEEATN